MSEDIIAVLCGVFIGLVLSFKFTWPKRNETDEYLRGCADAYAFLASNPTEDEIYQYWSSAHIDRDFAGKNAYAIGTIRVLEKVWRKLQAENKWGHYDDRTT